MNDFARRLLAWGYALLDCQMQSAHLARFGVVALPRAEFLARLQRLGAEPVADTAWQASGAAPP